MKWHLLFYPEHGEATDPGTEQGRKSMAFLVQCDAICMECGYTQHPPEGGKCPACGTGGKIDFKAVTRA